MLSGALRTAAFLALAAGLTAFLLPDQEAHAYSLWNAELTVDKVGQLFGCDNDNNSQDNCSDLSVLSDSAKSTPRDDRFTYRGKTYTVKELTWDRGSKLLSLGFDGIQGWAVKSQLGSLTLYVDGRAFPVRNATAATDFITWPFTPSPGWTNRQVVALKLVLEVHGRRLHDFKVQYAGDSRLRVSWRRHHIGTGGAYVIAWRKTSPAPAQSWLEGKTDISRWYPKNAMEVSYLGTHPSFLTPPLARGTYEVRLYVSAPRSGFFKPQISDLAFEVKGISQPRSLQAQRSPPGVALPPPALSSARVNGAALSLVFDGALDESSVPAASAFAVNVAGSARTVSAVSVSQQTVTLTLASAVTSGQVVTVGYTPPSTGKLRASGGGTAVTAFSGQAVTNDTAGGQQSLQQSEPPPPPLTASVASAPAEHKGKGKFTVQVAFSEAVAGAAKTAAKTMQVTGGTLTRARRAGAARWALDIRPSGNAAVTVTLPATSDCAASGAVCTADGRKLESALTHTVPGPAGLSVADASAQEGSGAPVDFAVTLSRASTGAVTVRYVTRDGTAKMGRDYRKAKGMLTFAAGETSKKVSVAVLDDAHDEGAETFLLKLHKPTGAVLADGEATGTIANADPLQQAWLARFGRTAASDAIAAVTARLETPRDAGSHVTLGGHRLSLDGSGSQPGLPPAGGFGGAGQRTLNR